MANNHRIIRLPMVMDRTGVSRSTIYQWIKEGRFPRQIKLGQRASGWVEGEIQSWLVARVAAQALSRNQ